MLLFVFILELVYNKAPQQLEYHIVFCLGVDNHSPAVAFLHDLSGQLVPIKGLRPLPQELVESLLDLIHCECLVISLIQRDFLEDDELFFDALLNFFPAKSVLGQPKLDCIFLPTSVLKLE